jgi:hypothetical protein
MTYFTKERGGIEVVLGKWFRYYVLGVMIMILLVLIYLAATIDKIHPAIFTANITDGLVRVLKTQEDVG